MTLQQFIDKYNGKAVDFDGYFGNQCVDLAQQYNKEMFNGPFLSGAAAKDIWNTYPPSIYDRVTNSPTGVPQAGDIIIWGTSYGPYGHIAICTEANVNNFKCLSQNDPTGALTQIKDYPNYNGVLGWLHPKQSVVIPPTDDCPLKLKQVTEERDRLNGVITLKDKEIAELKAKDANYEALVSEKNGISVQLAEVLKSQEVYKAEYDKANAPDGYKVQITHLEDTKKLQAEDITKLQTRVTYLETKYTNVKKPIQKLIIALAEKMGVQL